MRFIDLAFIQGPNGFAEKVAAAIADGEENIGKHSDVWRECKANLKEASLQKCFYCEMKDIRSDGTVDHFRPKSKYHWAAFRLDNFRFACTFCNSRRTDPKTGEVGGKGTGFPLVDGCNRATCEAEEHAEVPVLLDPCDATDPDFLDFRSDGTTVPKITDEADLQRMRALESIDAYHLNHSTLTEARRHLAVELGEKIVEAERAMLRYAEGDMSAKGQYTSAVCFLKRKINPNSELSVFAKRILQTQKNKPLVEGVLATA